MIKETSKYQLNISLPRKQKSDKFHLLRQKAASEATHWEATLSMEDQICKAETLWAMKTSQEDFLGFKWCTWTVPENVSRLCCSPENDNESHQGILCD